MILGTQTCSMSDIPLFTTRIQTRDIFYIFILVFSFPLIQFSYNEHKDVEVVLQIYILYT